MKKILKIIISMIMFLTVTKVKAYTYSEWSEEYPQEINELLIEKEVRYKWYKEIRKNEEYLEKNIGTQEFIDENDTKIVESKYEEYPEEKEDRVIEIKEEAINLTCKDTTDIMIRNLNSTVSLDVSEIEIYNKKTNELVNYTLKNESYNFLKDKDKNTFIKIGLRNVLIMLLNKKYDINDLKIEIYYKYTQEDYYISHYFSYKNKVSLYVLDAPLKQCEENCKLIFEPIVNCGKTAFRETFYYAKDILYKKYDIDKVYTEDYLKEKEGYIKDINKSKEFYRYIIDDKVLIYNSKVVEDESICQKNYCYLLENKKKKKENEKIETKTIEELKENKLSIENPQTSDNIKELLIQIFLSGLILIILIIIFIIRIYKMRSNKIKTISTFVESL